MLEVAELSGHTPDSVVFIDDAHRALYTGDAVGSDYRPDDLPGRGTGADCFRLSGGPGEI
ncbi:MAG: MBL fold metallo-hydrolase [Eubacteriales bacterium]